MIQARIRKRFPRTRDSAGFALDIELATSGGVTVLFGPSGAGKTLTLDSIAGFVRPDEGRILLDDLLLFDGAAKVHLPPQIRRCGYVFQNYALFPHMTLRENLAFAGHRLPRLERRRRVNEMLDRFGLGDLAGRQPHELSGGQKQRGSIARALITAPRLLLLDEPARGLDAPLRRQLYETLRQVREDFNTPILLVTHDLEECVNLGDEMFIYRDGAIVQSGAPADVVEHPANADVARLLDIYNLLPVEILALDPQRDSSRYRFAGAELAGPYFRGLLLGARVLLCIRPDQLDARARDGRPAPNHVPSRLLSTLERPGAMRLEFENGVHVDLAREEWEERKHNKEWVVAFPTRGVRAL
ncbi:MAG TPA: Fe3+/spermidine/putrescine ABC transporter ATP-binding protein [Solibacterales bacterium]|nr:Fe3+/spermidine/putrescine ABC transporter ATP-binding protein [Bryobacterales bacterium]